MKRRLREGINGKWHGRPRWLRNGLCTDLVPSANLRMYTSATMAGATTTGFSARIVEPQGHSPQRKTKRFYFGTKAHDWRRNMDNKKYCVYCKHHVGPFDLAQFIIGHRCSHPDGCDSVSGRPRLCWQMRLSSWCGEEAKWFEPKDPPHA